jgi:N-acetylneuraminate synthase/N,N'-diacetyllegionaminate synthase
MKTIEIHGHKIGFGHPVFIIAEAGVNHNGKFDSAKKLVDVALKAGADAIKFQSFKAERLATPDSPKAEYQKRNDGRKESHFKMFRRLELSEEDHLKIMRYCQKKDILFLSSPFDEESADMLEKIGVPVFKIPSGEITNLSFLSHVAQKGKPMIVSTGMSYLSEVEAAVQTIQKTGNNDIILLHCVSNYPTAPEDVNLRALCTMSEIFGRPTGFSDHTLGIEIAIGAVALGACVIEKHITLDQNLPGPDHRASMEPEEFGTLVRGIRKVEASLGHGRKEPASSEANMAAIARKSLVAARDIPAGTVITNELIAVKRPGTGLAPTMRSKLLGRAAKKNILAETLYTMQMLD